MIGVDISNGRGYAVLARFKGDVMYIDNVIQGDCISTPKYIIIDGIVLDR